MEKVVFDSSNFSEINYMNFDADFKIKIKDKIKIILGPNGTGKTSIYLNIKERHQDYSYIDYNDVEQSVIGLKNKIVIGASILKLDEKYSEKDKLINEINIKDNLAKYNITNTATAKSISDSLEVLRKNHEKAILEFNNDKLNSLYSLTDEDSNFIKDNFKNIKSIEKIETKVETIKDSYRKHILEEVERFLSDEERVCPICGLENKRNIKEIIKEELLKISDIKELVVKKYQEINSDLKSDEILEKVNSIVEFVKKNEIETNHIINYLLCGGSKEKADLIIKNIDLIKNINNEIEELELRKEQFYNNLKNKKDSLANTFKFQFDVKSTDINYNDKERNIEIKLPRKVEQYSTGEINLMTFMVCMLEFMANDKDCLIIDDPLSSYDIPNQYKIIYEIASSKNVNKQILVFTHNLNTINIANSQHNGLFNYDVLEKRKNTLYINNIDYSTKDNIISIENLQKYLEESYPHKKYLELLVKKDTWDDNIPDEYENHLIFHYDEPFFKNIEGYNYENTHLSDLIDNFDEDSFDNINYIENTANKIIYTAALRIWIEKQFYDITNNDSSLHGKEFGPKIKYMFEGGRWNGSPKVTKEYLMSKKVMLNQHIHQKSQEMPFYFALNLSLDDVAKEIVDIKEHFIV